MTKISNTKFLIAGVKKVVQLVSVVVRFSNNVSEK